MQTLLSTYHEAVIRTIRYLRENNDYSARLIKH